MDEVLALIYQKLRTLNEADDWDLATGTRAITALLPYAVWQEQNGQHDMFNTFLYTIRTLRKPWSTWLQIEPFVIMLLNEESTVSKKQAVVLLSPHLPWWVFKDEHLVQLWAAAVLEVPYTDEIGLSVVDTLLNIASNSHLQPHVPVIMWTWLNRRPFLPPICNGRAMGSALDVLQAVHGLRDAETLKSYLILIWSEWDCLFSRWDRHRVLHDALYPMGGPPCKEDLPQMCTTIKEVFSGVGMGHHQEDLLKRLDHVLGQLDLGLDYLQQHKPSLDEDAIQQMKEQYRELREVMLEVSRGSN